MELTLTILLVLVALICFLGGTNIMLKGAMSFLPEKTPPQPVLDNLMRFLAGIYLSAGFLCMYCAFHVAAVGPVIYFLGIMVLFSGLGRLYSRWKIGTAGTYFEWVMVFEIVLGLAIIALRWIM